LVRSIESTTLRKRRMMRSSSRLGTSFSAASIFSPDAFVWVSRAGREGSLRTRNSSTRSLAMSGFRASACSM
jgi:hypothetical protein